MVNPHLPIAVGLPRQVRCRSGRYPSSIIFERKGQLLIVERTSNGAGNLRQAIRLADKKMFWIDRPLALQYLLWLASCKDHLEVGSAHPRLAGEFRAVHSMRQDHIDEQQIDTMFTGDNC